MCSSDLWHGDERWGREIILPVNFDFALSGAGTRKPLQEWKDLGITQTSGAPIPVADMVASIVLPAGAAGPAFLVYDNYRTTLVYKIGRAHV